MSDKKLINDVSGHTKRPSRGNSKRKPPAKAASIPQRKAPSAVKTSAAPPPAKAASIPQRKAPSAVKTSAAPPATPPAAPPAAPPAVKTSAAPPPALRKLSAIYNTIESNCKKQHPTYDLLKNAAGRLNVLFVNPSTLDGFYDGVHASSPADDHVMSNIDLPSTYKTMFSFTSIEQSFNYKEPWLVFPYGAALFRMHRVILDGITSADADVRNAILTDFAILCKITHAWYKESDIFGYITRHEPIPLNPDDEADYGFDVMLQTGICYGCILDPALFIDLSLNQVPKNIIEIAKTTTYADVLQDILDFENYIAATHGSAIYWPLSILDIFNDALQTLVNGYRGMIWSKFLDVIATAKGSDIIEHANKLINPNAKALLQGCIRDTMRGDDQLDNMLNDERFLLTVLASFSNYVYLSSFLQMMLHLRIPNKKLNSEIIERQYPGRFEPYIFPTWPFDANGFVNKLVGKVIAYHNRNHIAIWSCMFLINRSYSVKVGSETVKLPAVYAVFEICDDFKCTFENIKNLKREIAPNTYMYPLRHIEGGSNTKWIIAAMLIAIAIIAIVVVTLICVRSESIVQSQTANVPLQSHT